MEDLYSVIWNINSYILYYMIYILLYRVSKVILFSTARSIDILLYSAFSTLLFYIIWNIDGPQLFYSGLYGSILYRISTAAEFYIVWNIYIILYKTYVALLFYGVPKVEEIQ